MRDDSFSLCTSISVALFLSMLAGCGGSRNSSQGDPADFSLGAGHVETAWASTSSELIHDLSRGALYYLDVENANIMAITVDGGAEQVLQLLPFEPAKMRMTTDFDSLYVLESDASAQDNDGAADVIRYSISGDYLDTDYVELDVNVSTADFVATTDRQLVVSNYDTLVPPDVTPQAQTLNLYDFYSGSLLDSATYSGAVWTRLALKDDQQTLVSELMYASATGFDVLSIAGGTVGVVQTETMSLGFAAYNTFEPAGDRLFRSNGEVRFADDASASLTNGYVSIDFDQSSDRIVTLVDSAGGFLMHYYDSKSLDLLSEQALPTIVDAAGMEPVSAFVDSGDLYVVYRELTSSTPRNFLLVKFDYPR